MFLEKLLLGVTLAAPIGPVSIELIRRSLATGFISAVIVCIGAILGDGICLMCAYYGFTTFISNDLTLGIVGLLGSLFILYLGISNIKKSSITLDVDANQNVSTSFMRSVALGVMLAVVNPVSMIFWMSVFAASAASEGSLSFAPNLPILIGAFIWGVFLCFMVATSKKILSNKAATIITVFSSVILLYFGGKYLLISVDNITAGLQAWT